nr:uncharacterized protein LOC109154451 [Ipomoea batatas]
MPSENNCIIEDVDNEVNFLNPYDFNDSDSFDSSDDDDENCVDTSASNGEPRRHASSDFPHLPDFVCGDGSGHDNGDSDFSIIGGNGLNHANGGQRRARPWQSPPLFSGVGSGDGIALLPDDLRTAVRAEWRRWRATAGGILSAEVEGGELPSVRQKQSNGEFHPCFPSAVQGSEHHTSLRNLEIQVAQNSKALTERPQGSLPSTTVNNPRERAQAVTLRSGKELPEPILKKSTNPKSPIEEEIVEEILEDDKGQEKEEPSPPLSSKATQAQDKGKEKVDLPIKTGNDTYLKLLCDDNDNDLESFVFDENVLSSENDNDVHDALHDVLDDDDVNDNDGLCDLNDVEFVNFFDDCQKSKLSSSQRHLTSKVKMPTNTRSKERAKKTKHDREASSSRAQQGVSDLIAPGGRGLPHLTEKQRERVEELQQKGVSGGFFFDYALLDAYGCREEVEQMMSRPYWERLFSWRDDTYEPVVHEFVATFEPVPSSHDCTPCMKFNIFGRGYQLSIIQLGERLGLYTHEETISEEWINLPTDFDSDAAVEAYWSRITNGRGGRFTGVKQSTSKIVSPSLKMMKLLLNLTFGGRNKNLHKVYRFNLFHLWSLEMNEPIQMAHVVQQMFHSQKNAKCPYVWIGPVVTRLCHGLGLQGELAREKVIATMQPFTDAHLNRSYVQRVGDMPRHPREELSRSQWSRGDRMCPRSMQTIRQCTIGHP